MSKRNPYDQKRLIFIDLIKNNRKEQGITQIELSKKLDKPQSFVSKYENGERTLDIVETYQICLALNMSFVGLMKQFNNKVESR